MHYKNIWQTLQRIWWNRTSFYEALQDTVYIPLPPGINFGLSYQRSEITKMWFFGLPLSPRVNILQKIQSETSHIMHHTSHITYYIGVCKFYKILVIRPVVPFNNSSKQILKKFGKYLLKKIKQTPISIPNLVTPNISWWKDTLSKKSFFLMKIQLHLHSWAKSHNTQIFRCNPMFSI